MASVRQPSFAAGELAPALYGRTDLPRYLAGLRRCYNFFVSRQGNAVSRAGAQFLGLANASILSLSREIGGLYEQLVQGGTVKLVPFLYSDTDTTQNYVLEFGYQSLRIWKNGALLTFTLTGVIPYISATLYKLRWVQSGDTLTLTHPDYPPATLQRVGTDATWTYAVLTFSRLPPQTLLPSSPSTATVDETSWNLWSVDLANHPLQLWSWLVTELIEGVNGNVSESAPVKCNGVFYYTGQWNVFMSYQTGTIVTYTNSVGNVRFARALSTVPPNTKPPDSGYNTYWTVVTPYDNMHTYGLPDACADYTVSPPICYESQNSPNFNQSLTNTAYWKTQGETGSNQVDSYAGADTSVCLYPDRPVLIHLQGPNTPPAPASGTFVGYRIYRGRAGIYGWVGDSLGPTFTDMGLTPDLTTSPPEGIDPFDTTPGDDYTAEPPTAVTYFQDRLVMGGTPTRPASIFASATGDYSNFDQHLVAVDSDSVIFNLLARKREVIRWLVGLDKLFVGTNSGIWVVEGAGQSPLAADSVDAHVYSDVGTDWPNPLIIGGSVLYARDKGTGVRGLQFDWQRGGYASASLSDPAEHLFLGYSIADWCFAEDPWALAWIARNDGLLLSGTFCAEDNLWAWAQHQIQGPVAADTVGGRQVISVCSITEGQEDVLYLALAGIPIVTTPYNSGTTYGVGSYVTDGSGNIYRSLQNANTGNLLSNNSWWVPWGSPTGTAWIMRLSTRLLNAAKDPVCLDSYIEAANPTVTAGSITITIPSTTFLGGIFIGIPMMANIDGTISGPYTPILFSGSIMVTIPINANTSPTNAPKFARIGFPYNCELELLDLPEGRTQRKVVEEADFECIGTGTLLVGADSSHLSTTKAISATNQLLRAPVKGNWNTAGRAFLRQLNPVPLTVVGVTRKTETDEDP